MPQPKLLVTEPAAAQDAAEHTEENTAAAQTADITQAMETAQAQETVALHPVRQPAARPGLRHNTWAIWTAVGLSALWLALGALYVSALFNWRIAALPPHEMAGLIGGLFMPIAVFWFIALYVRRSEDLKHAARALERSLVPLGFPGEAGERRIESVSRILSVHALELRAAIEMAQKEAARIEDLFTQQTFRLAETTDEAGKRAALVKDMLSTNHTEIDQRIAALETKAQELDSMLKARSQSLGDSATTLAEKLLAVDGILETTLHNMACAGTAADQRANAFSRQLRDSAGEFELTLGQAEGTAARIAQALEGERKALTATSHKVQSEGASLRATLKDEQAALERTAQSLAASSQQARDAMLAQVRLLDGSAGKWNEAIGAASSGATQHLEGLTAAANDTIKAVATAAEDAQAILRQSGEGFAGEGTRLIAAAEATASRLDEHVSGLRSLAGEAEQHWREAFERTLEAARQTADAVTAGTGDMVLAGDLAAEKLAGRMDRLKEGWSERLWELEKATTQTIHQAKASSDLLGETAQQVGGRVAELVEKLREASGFAQDQQAGIKTVVGHIAGDVRDATSALATEQERLHKEVAAAYDGTAKLEHLLAAMSGDVGRLLADIAEKTDGIERSITGHGEKLSDASRLAGERMAQADLAFEAASGRMAGSGEALLTQIERISREAAQAQDQLAAAGLSSGQAAEQLSAAAAGAMERLGELAQTLESKAELVHRLNGQSGEVLQSASGTLVGHAADIEHRVSKAAEVLRSAGDLFGKTVDDGESRAVGAADALNRVIAALNDKVAGLADNVAEVKSRLENAAGDIGAGEATALARFNEAVTLLTNAESQLREQAFALVGMAERTASRLEDVGGNITGNAESIIAASQDAESAASRLGSHFAQELANLESVLARLNKDQASFASNLGETADASFMREAGQITESLNSLAIDIDRVLEADLPDTAWQQYLKGDKSLFARRIVKLGTKEARRRISERYASNVEFQGHVDRFCKRFEVLLRRAAGNDRDGTVSVTLVSSHMGRLYVLLGQSIRRIS